GSRTRRTARPSQGGPCTNTGESFRYRFFFLTGQGAATGVLSPFGAGGAMSFFREDLGRGLVESNQSQSPSGEVNDTLLFPQGSLLQRNTGLLHANTRSGKEQRGA